MFGFSKRRMKLGRLKVHLSDAGPGTRSPLRPPKRVSVNNAQGLTPAVNSSEASSESSSGTPDLSNCTSGNSENWMVLSVTGDKPAPRFNHAAAVVGNKMVVVGGETGNKLLDDVQVLNFDRYSWSTASSKLYLSPTSLPLKIPACKGHALVSWGKKVLLVGGRIDPASDKVSVWSFDTETECWSLLEAKGDIPVARSGHTIVRASANLIMFGGEDTRRRKLNDLHMFDLKSFTWLPLDCTGPRPSPRSNHVATIYDDKSLLIFGGSSKSKTLNDLHSLDFETMVWSRIKFRGFHPSPRAGCCGALHGSRWYIVGGGNKKKRRSETLILDLIKFEWSVVITSPSSSITSNKGFSLVLWQHKEKDYLVSFGGFKKDLSDQVEVLTVERNDSSGSRRSTLSKVAGSLLSENLISATAVNGGTVDSVARQNIASAVEHHGSGRRSLSESLLNDHPGSSLGNVSLRKQFHDEEGTAEKGPKFSEDRSLHKVMDQKVKQHEKGDNSTATETSSASEPGNVVNHRRQGSGSFSLDSDDILTQENDGKSSMASNVYQFYDAKVASLMKKNGILEGQLGTARSGRESAERNLSAALKSKQETEKKLADTTKEIDLLKEKLSRMEMAEDEANNLSNIVHSDNVRLEHDVAFLKAVFDDTQKELLSTRGVLAGERARAFQLQVEVFHLKQRLQSLENRAPTPRKPY